MIRESTEDALRRWERLELIQQAYPEFVPFLRDGMEELGFKTSEIQEDIGLWLQHGPSMLGIMAQRGEAKTTIIALFAIWLLIHEPALRVLIVSAGEDLATEISTLIVRLITAWDILEPLRPDTRAGDKTSVEHFDVHHSLKGIDKSPSVACLGIKSNLPGKRADILIADDIESPKNAMTAPNRAELEHLTKEFSSIVVDRKDQQGRITHLGRIVWAGTPQTSDSIYNGLPSRGVEVRIWPGRYPNEEQEAHYGDALAPIIKRRLAAGAERTGYGLDGKLGAAVDPMLRDEATLLLKEADQGPAHFQLQFMLLTAMTDAMRHPLKTDKLIVMPMPGRLHPLTVVPGFGQSEKFTVHGKTYRVSVPHDVSQEVAELQSSVLYLDPAGGGQNGDETAYAFGGLLNGSIRVIEWSGMPGGHEEHHLKAIAALAVRLAKTYGLTTIKVEKNFGFGLFLSALRPIVTAAFEKERLPLPGFDEDMVSGQKELRIIGVLEAPMGRGAVVMNRAILENEAASTAAYEPRLRQVYSGLFQLSKITRDKKSLIHDDRADALAGLVAHYGAALAIDQRKAIESILRAQDAKKEANPLNYPAYALRNPAAQSGIRARMRKL